MPDAKGVVGPLKHSAIRIPSQPAIHSPIEPEYLVGKRDEHDGPEQVQY
jgi:hypothetical protein